MKPCIKVGFLLLERGRNKKIFEFQIQIFFISTTA